MTHTTMPAQSPIATTVLNPWSIPLLTGEIVQFLVLSSIDPAIAVIAVIACVSLVTQGLADIAWPNGMTSPIGISGFLIAPSGAGEALVMRRLTEPIHRFVQKRAQLGLKEDRRPLFLIEDATREAVILHLIEWAVAGLFTDEAGQIKALLRNGAPTLAKLIDGSPLQHARISRGRAALQNHRFTMLGMARPNVFDSNILLGSGKGGIGLINRFLVGQASCPPYRSAMPTFGLSPEIFSRYEECVSALLDRTIDIVLTGDARPTLRMDKSALRRFVQIAGEMTAARSDPDLTGVGEYISRHGERVLRVAGALHVFHHGTAEDVRLESIEAAHQIGLWSIRSYADLANAPPKPTQAEEDAACIENELTRLTRLYGSQFRLSELRRMSLNIGLPKTRFDRALPLLARAGKITLYMQWREDFVNVNLPPASLLGCDPMY